MAFAYDVVILTSGKFLDTIYDLAESAFRELGGWARKNILSINTLRLKCYFLIGDTRYRTLEKTFHSHSSFDRLFLLNIPSREYWEIRSNDPTRSCKHKYRRLNVALTHGPEFFLQTSWHLTASFRLKCLRQVKQQSLLMKVENETPIVYIRGWPGCH